MNTILNCMLLPMIWLFPIDHTNIGSPQTHRKPVVHPIVIFSSDLEHGELIGGSAGSKWIEQEELGKSLKAQNYTIYSQTERIGVAKGSAPFLGTDPPDQFQYCVKLEATTGKVKPVLGLAAGWNALPRVCRVIPNSTPACSTAVREFLNSRGFPRVKVHVDQAFQVDLDGDGIDEIVLSATLPGSDTRGTAQKGDYTLVLLLIKQGGQLMTVHVEGEINRVGGESMSGLNKSEVLGFYDLDGDGVLELITKYKAYEAFGSTVYRFSHGRVQQVLSAGTGV